MKLLLPLLAALAGFAPAVRAADAAPVPLTPPILHLIGDSTMADKPVDPPNPEHGWGQMLPLLFPAPGRIQNHAVNGRSTKSFIDEGRWQKVSDALRPGDCVIIQFGHNDEKTEDPARYAAPDDGYRANLTRFIQETRAKGAIPILATPVARRRWDAAGQLVDTHGAYPDAMRAVAELEKVPLLELNRLTTELEKAHGPEGSKKLHLWIEPGVYTRKPGGYKDDTHFSAYGATAVATLAVREMIRLGLPPADWLK
jgi:lysophospholipase L1-like esterase